jgi:hypothetical protein
MIAGITNHHVRRRLRQWLTGTGPSAGLLGRSRHPETASSENRLDPTAARKANRDAIEFALEAGYSGFVRISRAGSLHGPGEAYDSRHNQLPDAPPLVAAIAVAGELSGDSGFTSDAGEPAHQAARSVGSAGLE